MKQQVIIQQSAGMTPYQAYAILLTSRDDNLERTGQKPIDKPNLAEGGMTERDRKLRELKVQVQKRRMIANSLKSPQQINASYQHALIKNFHENLGPGSPQMGLILNDYYILGGRSPKRSPQMSINGISQMSKKEEVKRRISQMRYSEERIYLKGQ